MSDSLSPAALRRIALDAAWSVGPALRAAFRAPMDVETKTSAHDLVTVHDQRTEEQLIAQLTDEVPDSRITGEEGGAQGSGRVEWIIDPIDGTSNFAHGFAMFSVSIAAAVDDEVVAGVVHDPVNQLTFSADDTNSYLQTAETLETILKPAQRTPDDGEHQLNLVTSFPSPEMLREYGDEALNRFGQLVNTYATTRRVVSGALELCHAAAGWADIAAGTRTKPWDVGAGQLVLRRAGGRYLAFGERGGQRFIGEESPRGHLAPDYVGLAPGVVAPTIYEVIANFAQRPIS